MKFEWFKLMEIIISNAQMHRYLYCTYRENSFKTNNILLSIYELIKLGGNCINQQKNLLKKTNWTLLAILNSYNNTVFELLEAIAFTLKNGINELFIK